MGQINERIQIRVDKPFKDSLDDMCNNIGMTVTEFAFDAILEKLIRLRSEPDEYKFLINYANKKLSRLNRRKDIKSIQYPAHMYKILNRKIGVHVKNYLSGFVTKQFTVKMLTKLLKANKELFESYSEDGKAIVRHIVKLQKKLDKDGLGSIISYLKQTDDIDVYKTKSKDLIGKKTKKYKKKK